LRPDSGDNATIYGIGANMRRRIVISAVIISLILALFAAFAAFGYFRFGWWQPPHDVFVQTQSGFHASSEPTTLPAVLALAHDALGQFGREIHDYSGVIVKTERDGAQLTSTVMFVKIREKPFSAYLYFLDRSNDKSVIGREVIYVDGQNGGNLLVHRPGLLTGGMTLSLPPKGLLAMLGERHSIMEIGLANLCRQLIERGEAAGESNEVQVRQFDRARINDRACTLIQIMYAVHEPKLWGYLARVFIDKERKFPIRVEVFELPAERSRGPQLLEEYTYLNLKFNNGYTDLDFDPKNRQYKFP
jgi:hypothetical protein